MSHHLGARIADAATSFRVWAPKHDRLQVEFVVPRKLTLDLQRDESGYHTATLENTHAGTEYFIRLADALRPDPASRHQPHGVHGPSGVVSLDHGWTDRAWKNPPLDRHVIYELHVGTFTHAGTFAAIIERLPDLARLGVTAIELMPIAEFPGTRNWGYDGVCLFAAHHAYGGASGLCALVNACHAHGLAVFLDVVYNHLGPEGNYLAEFGPYFTDKYKTPWGPALNFDGHASDHVRNFFIQNALYWVRDCHVDGLRLDAVHAIVDHTATSFVEELTRAVHDYAAASERTIHVIAESSDNDPRLIHPESAGGFAMDAVWNDDFHHAARTLLTGEHDGYYADYGATNHLARAFTDGFTYTGQYSPFRGRRHGRSTNAPGSRFVVCSQNHDQVGNRPLGDRLENTAGFEGCKVAAGLVLLSPFVPLLFMGEEYAESAPFQYFVNHTDPHLIEAVRRGRREEFSWFDWDGDPPDPQAEETFTKCRLDWALRTNGRHAAMLAYYTELLRLRRTQPALASTNLAELSVELQPDRKVIVIHRAAGDARAMIAANFEHEPVAVAASLRAGTWTRSLDSTESKWAGSGGPAHAAFVSDGSVLTLLLPTRSLLLFTQGSP